MTNKTVIICVCDEASKSECTDARCLKHRNLQPTSCLNCEIWKRSDNTRPSITDFLKSD
jgi:hypothetical protein